MKRLLLSILLFPLFLAGQTLPTSNLTYIKKTGSSQDKDLSDSFNLPSGFTFTAKTGSTVNLSAATLLFGNNKIPWAVVSKSGASLADLPTRNFSDLQSKPTTLSGYGITDAATQSYVNTQLAAHTSNTNNPHSTTKAQVGLGNADNTSDANKPLSSAAVTALAGKASASGLSAHIADTNNPHSTTKAQVGLGNADNTSDASKPISTATASALAAKASTSALTAHTGNTSNPHNVTKTQVGLANVDNTTDANKPISTATASALALKASAATVASHLADTANPHSTTKAQVGLANADNTSDANKPLSTAAVSALAAKADSSAIPAAITAERSATRTLTNVTMSGSNNTFSNLPASAIGSGVFAPSRLGTGTPDGTKYLRDDGVYAVPPGGGGGTASWGGLTGAPGDSSALTTLLNAKANANNAALTGNPTAPTQTTGNNSTRIATTAYVDSAIAAVPSGGDVTASAAFGTTDRLLVSDGTGKGVKKTPITVDSSGNATGFNTVSIETLDVSGFTGGNLPINHGGTNAATIQAARTNLVNPDVAAVEASNAVTYNLALGNRFVTTLNANLTTVTLSNFNDGDDMEVKMINPSTYTVTWGNSIDWPGGTQPVQSTNKYDIWKLKKFAGVISGNVVANYTYVAPPTPTPTPSPTPTPTATPTPTPSPTPTPGGGGFEFVENFEGSTPDAGSNIGYDNTGWESYVDSGGTANLPHYSTSPAPLQGSYSYRAGAGDYTSISRILASQRDSLYMAGNVYFIGINDGQVPLLWVRNQYATVLSHFSTGNGGNLRVQADIANGGGAAVSETPGTLATKYWFWLEWTRGTGSNMSIKVYLSTTSTRPGSPSMQSNNGTATDQANEIVLFGNTQVLWDHIVISTTPIGSGF